MLRFAERMEGELEVDGRSEPFAFEIDCRAPDVLAPLELSGEVQMNGASGPVDPGVSRLEIGLPVRRHLRYTLGWTGPAGERYRFFGEKTFRLLRPFKTISTLPGRVYRDGEEVGEAKLRFPWRTLPGFLASFRVWPS